MVILRIMSLIIISIVSTVPSTATCPYADERAITPTGSAFNRNFLEAMWQAKQQVVSEIGPVIICGPDKIYLYVNGKQEAVENSSSATYHAAKNISHVPATLASHLSFTGRKVCPHLRDEGSASTEFYLEETMKSMSSNSTANLRSDSSDSSGRDDDAVMGSTSVDVIKYLSDLRIYRKYIEEKFDESFTVVHLPILDNTIKFIEEMILDEAGEVILRVPQTSFDRYFLEINGYVSSSVEMSAENKIHAIHDLLKKWQKSLPQIAWHELRVIVKGVDQARNNNILITYFRAFMNKIGIKTQLDDLDDPARILFFPIYETLEEDGEDVDNTYALEALASRIVHRVPSACVLSDPNALERGDILYSVKLMQKIAELIENEVAIIF